MSLSCFNGSGTAGLCFVDRERKGCGYSYVHIRRVRWQAGYTSPVLHLLDGVPDRRLLAVELLAQGIRLSDQRDFPFLRICAIDVKSAFDSTSYVRCPWSAVGRCS